MNPEKNITVVFLMWLPYGFNVFDQFLNSYLQYNSGIPHDLLIIFKGRTGYEKEETNCCKLLSDKNVNYQSIYFDGGLDLDAYLYAAKNINNDYVFFLNTRSVLLADRWLVKMNQTITEDRVGMVSATGSWQSNRSTVFYLLKWGYNRNQGLSENFSKYKMLIKATFYYPFLYRSFPNPHLRTNGFMMRRSLFLKLKWKPLKSKFRAYLCESGRNSITNQVIRAGYQPMVVDKTGKAYTVTEWADSKTFWIGEQENLLIADNQTMLYEKADNQYKKYLTHVGWGKNE